MKCAFPEDGKHRKNELEIVLRLDPIHAVIGAEEKVVADIQRPEQPPALRNVRNPPRNDRVRRTAGQILAIQMKRSASQPDHAGYCRQQGGLAGAVRAHDRDDGVASNVKIDSPQHLHVAVSGFQSPNTQ